MAGTGVWASLLERHRARLTKDPDMNKVVSRLMQRGIFSIPEARQLASAADASERADLLIEKLSRDPEAFREFCMTLEEFAPHLLSEFLLDSGEVFASADTRALQLGFQLAVSERDAAVREHARTAEDLVDAHRKLDILQQERDRAVNSLENLSARLDKPANPKRFEGSVAGRTSGSSLQRTSQDSDPAVVEESGDNVVWQIHRVTLQRVANYGFGIAVSGGRDSPHFANGDPSIAISDVLKAGPAEGKLQLNDRIISVNGISLENVSHSTAIQVLKNSGDTVHLVVRRRVIMPAAVEKETPPLKVTLTKKNKKDDFGLVLGCRYYIHDLLPDSLAAQDGGLKLGDSVLKINNTPLEGLSLPEVKKLLDKSKDRLQLIVSKAASSDDRPRHQSNPSRIDEGYATFRPPTNKDDVNIYRPSVRSEEDLYPGELPPGAYPPSGHPHMDGRYIYDHEAPPRPPLPSGFPREGPHSPGREPLHADDFYTSPRRDQDGYYSDRDMDGYRGPPEDDVHPPQHHDERYVGLRSDIRTDIRRVVFMKDRQKGLGLRLAGGNATGIFIASVQPGSAAEAEGLVEGDQILQANGLDIVGLTREEAVAYLTSLEGQVTLIVQYKKEDYDSIMASHEAGDSFYIRTHFNYQPAENSGEHGFKVGDIFHIKDTLFRGVGGSWLAIRVGPNGEELKKGTIPNKKKAEVIAATQQQGGAMKEPFPSKGRGSLFKRKSARRAKSLGKDHWEEVIFSDDGGAGLATKFPPYERVILRDPAFVRPVVVFGAIADVARDKLLSEFPDLFESPQTDKGVENDPKKGKTGIIRFGAIREAMTHQKHCVLDVTPYHVDRLNYAQYYPIVVFLRADSKQAIKEVRSRWRGGTNTNKNPKKLQEHNERMESLYAHLFTGTANHTTTEAWFPKLVEMIESQQRRPVWMSEKKPEEDFNDDFMFPMPNRMSLAGSPESELDLARPSDDLDMSPMQKKRLVRSSSDPSINTADRVPSIPPYPAPPRYSNSKMPPFSDRDDWDDYRNPQRLQDRDGDWQMHPDDRYYPHPHHPPEGGWSSQSHLHQHPQQQQPYAHRSRSNIDVYATITPSERARNRVSDDHFPGSYDEYGPQRDRLPLEEPHRMPGPHQPGMPHDGQMAPPSGLGPEHRGYNDASSHDSDSYSRYVSSPANKHDDSKLRDKFGSLQVGGRERGPAPSHDPYRFTRSTANPVLRANIDRAKLSDLSARYRREDKQRQAPGKPGTATSPTAAGTPPDGGRLSLKKKEPPPVPAKTYSLKEVGMDLEEIKARNYENSNRAYNYSEVAFTPQPSQQSPLDTRHQDPPPAPPPQKSSNSPYEYIAIRPQNRQSAPGRGDNPPQHAHDKYPDELVSGSYEVPQLSRAFANHVYMDHREVERVRSGAGDAERDALMRDGSVYTRPRTDDEQLRDLQRNRSRIKSDSRMPDRAKSESRLNDRGEARWNKYKSWDYEKEGRRTFDSYKKLITPGFYGSRKTMSKSHDELREESLETEGGPPARTTYREDNRNSAFEAYRKPASEAMRAAIQEDLLPGREREEGQTVVATARGVFTSEGGILESKETGVSIVIPPGALPPGVEQEIYFKVCSGNSILPPLDEDKGETLLSPLVMCGPHGLQFKKPVELKLPHSASVNPESWSFALKSSDSPSGQPTQWQNMTLAGSEGVAQGRVNQNSVSVLVDHF